MRDAEKNKKEQDGYLNQAFKDIESLKTITEEMVFHLKFVIQLINNLNKVFKNHLHFQVKLAQSINIRLSKESAESEASADEISTFRTNLFKLGIPNPVTKYVLRKIFF